MATFAGFTSIVRRVSIIAATAASFSLTALLTRAQESSSAEGAPKSTVAKEADSSSEATKPQPAPAQPEPKGAKRLTRDYPVWIDPKEKAVLVDGQIALRQGMLEMFACTRNTKEHESIVSANTKAQFVHAGLVSLGAEPGHPVQFQPQFRPPSGTEIEVFVRWNDENGKRHEVRAQDWIKDQKTGKPMTYPFVFGGSYFIKDPETGREHYAAEGGDFVCVSNFGTAMLDIPVKSSQSNEELEFSAFMEKIPPLGTPVRLIFKPKLKRQGDGNKEQGGRQASGDTRRKSKTNVSANNTTEYNAKKSAGEAK
jgi:hypothetical protein